MKVIDLIKKYRMCSNADVFLQTPDGEIAKLDRNEIKEPKPGVLMDATVYSFDVIDNVLTVHIHKKIAPQILWRVPVLLSIEIVIYFYAQFYH